MSILAGLTAKSSRLRGLNLCLQEDLCLMQDDPSTPTSMKFTAGAVLFPQRWSLIEKLGMDLHRIHDPVPQYEQEVSHSQPAWCSGQRLLSPCPLQQPDPAHCPLLAFTRQQYPNGGRQ